MTDYTKKSFTVSLGSDAYRDNWDRVFGKKQEQAVQQPEQTERWELCPACGRGHFCTQQK